MRKSLRSCHYRRRNHSSAAPSNFLFVDVLRKTSQASGPRKRRYAQADFGVAEALRWEGGKIRRWSATTFYSPEQFWIWFGSRERANTSLWIVGYSIGATMTLLGLWDLVDKGTFRLQPHAKGKKGTAKVERETKKQADGLLVDADPPTIILLHGKGFVVHIVDIRNYGNATIEEIASEVGEPLPELPAIAAAQAERETYLEHAVRAVRRYFLALVDWWQKGDYGVWKHTAGGLALAAYRHRFMVQPDLIHDCEIALQKERAALVGGQWVLNWAGKVRHWISEFSPAPPKSFGRVIPWRYGPVHQMDINGLYPSVMRDNLFPVEFVAFKEAGSFDDVQAWRKRLLLIADVLIDTEEATYPVWAEKERWFAIGKFWTTLCGPELIRAIDCGHVRQIGWIGAYLPGRIFPAFVEHFHAEKLRAAQAEEKLRAQFAKLMLVSLPGKFGQRAPQWDFVDDVNPLKRWGTLPYVDADTGEVTQRRYIAGYTQIENALEEGKESNPAIEAFVNCYGREKMRMLREFVGQPHWIYQACDSLFVDDAGREKLLPYMESYPGELGKFRLVRSIGRAEFRGPNDYTADGEKTIAGIKSSAQWDRNGNAIQDKEITLRLVLARQPNGLLRIEEEKVSVGHYHPRGRWMPNGSVLPPQCVNGVIYLDQDAIAAERF
jgi:hypothetical protein